MLKKYFTTNIKISQHEHPNKNIPTNQLMISNCFLKLSENNIAFRGFRTRMKPQRERLSNIQIPYDVELY